MNSETARREIESLDYYLQNHTNDYNEESHTAMMMAIDALSSSEKPNKWIPVSERLPENDEDVLVCYPQGGMEVVYYHIDNSIYPTEYKDLNETGWCNEEGDALYFEPIAWMPLPKPYEPQESEVKE